jgi:hypothetical protein
VLFQLKIIAMKKKSLHAGKMANGSSHQINGGVLYEDCRQKKNFRTNISAPLPVIFLLHQ